MVRILLIFSRSIYRSGLIFSLSKYLVPCDFKFDTRDRFDIRNPLNFSLTLGRLNPVNKYPTPAHTPKASPIKEVSVVVRRVYVSLTWRQTKVYMTWNYDVKYIFSLISSTFFQESAHLVLHVLTISCYSIWLLHDIRFVFSLVGNHQRN